jgi:hypothetical protein
MWLPQALRTLSSIKHEKMGVTRFPPTAVERMNTKELQQTWSRHRENNSISWDEESLRREEDPRWRQVVP